MSESRARTLSAGFDAVAVTSFDASLAAGVPAGSFAGDFTSAGVASWDAVVAGIGPEIDFPTTLYIRRGLSGTAYLRRSHASTERIRRTLSSEETI